MINSSNKKNTTIIIAKNKMYIGKYDSTNLTNSLILLSNE